MNGEKCFWCEKTMGNSGHTYKELPCHVKCEDLACSDGLYFKRFEEKYANCVEGEEGSAWMEEEEKQ